MNTPNTALPVIRQVVLLMLCACLLVPLVLWLLAARPTQEAYQPAQTRAAMDALFAAIAPVRGQPARPPDAAALAPVLAHCAKEPPHQGLPFLDDVAEHLQALDQHLADLTGAPNRRNAPLRMRYQLQADEWATQLRGRGIDCQQAARALRMVASPSGSRLLAQAQWREWRPGQQGTGPAVQLAPTSLVQADPWRGWPGCLWIGGIAPDSIAYQVPGGGPSGWQQRLCAETPMRPPNAREVLTAGASASADRGGNPVPPDLHVLLAELDALRLPQGRLYQDYVQALPSRSNRRFVGGGEVELGFNVQLTIDPRTQSIAQRMARCYTGQREACEQAGLAWDRVGAAEGPGAAAMWEGAATRMTAVAVIDVASGRIEALAGAHTPCFAQENDGPFRDAGCLPLWTEPRRRPDALLNHAVHTDYLPGSTIKPILASVFFEDAPESAAQLTRWLAASDTNRFNDTLFCLTLAPRGLCERPARAQQRARDLGWNVDCDRQPSPRCGRFDLLFGRRPGARQVDPALESAGLVAAAPLQAEALAGRLFAAATPGTGFSLMNLPALRREDAASCRDASGAWHAAQCDSAAMKPLVNEAAGQGQARTTALGLATMLARLAAAANGQRELRRPHLVERITDAEGRPIATAATRTEADGAPALAQAEPTVVAPPVAQSVFRGLAQASAPGGTAHLICRHVFGARCAQAGSRIAGKTGTPSFTLDRLTFGQARQRCRGQPQAEDCLERPMKLYVAAVQPGGEPAGRYTKVIAVMSERNWMLDSRALPAGRRDRVHGGSNDANNIATEIAMRIADQAWLGDAAGAATGVPAKP